MQILLLGFFVLVTLALGSVLGLDLLGDKSRLVSVFELFTRHNFAIGLALSILIAALLAVVVFAWLSWRRRRPIAALIQWLDEKAPTSEALAANLDDFAAQIPAVHAPLGHAWEEFAETLIRPDPNRPADGGVVRNTVRPAAYFNLQATVEAGFHLPFWQALPNYFVGFGLLCTFLGLVSGLHFAAAGVASADAALARESLRDLLDAATFKFLTSIAGVLASLSLSVFVRTQVQSLQSVLDRFCSALEKRMSFVTPEWLALEQLREQQKLTLTLERFNTDFAAQLAEALEQRMTKALTTPEGKNVFVAAIENLGETFKGNAGEMGKEVSDSVVGGITGPLATLAEAMAELSTASGGAVDRVNEFSNTYSQKITQATERFEQGIKAAADEIRAAAEAASKSVMEGAATAGNTFTQGGTAAGGKIDEAGDRMLNALTPLVNNITSLQDTLAQMQRTFTDYDGRVQSMKGGMDDSTRALGDVSRSFQSTATALGASAQPVREAAAALIDSAQKSGQVSDTLKAALENVQRLGEAITATQTRLGTAWEQYRERFEQTDQHLAATFDTLQGGIRETEDQVKTFVGELDKHFANAVSSLGGAVSDLAETAEELSNAKRR
ncbi:MAG: anti-phage defense protein ZorA [Gammaproteobacteria bacterium]|nr:anti-phage defense protein ZorA [Gammaproteobacteria bacterium]